MSTRYNSPVTVSKARSDLCTQHASLFFCACALPIVAKITKSDAGGGPETRLQLGEWPYYIGKGSGTPPVQEFFIDTLACGISSFRVRGDLYSKGSLMALLLQKSPKFTYL